MEKLVEFLKRHADITAAAVLFLVTILFFLPGVGFEPSLLDDTAYTGKEYLLFPTWENVIYHLKTPVLTLYSPLVMFSFMLDYAVWGKDMLLLGGRLHNIILHSCNAVLFYFLLRKVRFGRFSPENPLQLSIPAAILGAVCFALHPQRVESVIWLVERKDVQALFFGLASTLCFLHSFRKNRLPLAGALLYLISFGAKPTVVTLPGVLFLLMWMDSTEFQWKKFLKMLVPYLAVLLLYVCLNIVQLSGVASGSAAGAVSGERLEIVALNYANYFFRTLLPLGIQPLYPAFSFADWGMKLLFAGFAAVVLAAVVPAFIKWRHQQLFLGVFAPLLLAFIGTALPMVGFKVIGNAEFTDRYSYFPALWIVMSLAFSYDLIASRRFIWQFFFWAYCGLIAVLGFCYLQTWQTKDSFINVMLGDGSRVNPAAWHIAACYYFDQENYELALQLAANAVEKNDPVFRKRDELFLQAMYGVWHLRNGNPEGLILIDEAICTPEWGVFRYTTKGFSEVVLLTALEEHLRRNTPEDREFAIAILKVLRELSLGADPMRDLNYRALTAYLQEDYQAAVKITEEALQYAPDDAHLLQNLRQYRMMIELKNSPEAAASN